MNITFQPIQKDTPEFLFSLLESSFPPEERRCNADMLRVIEKNENFHPKIICADKKQVGILTYWLFPAFCYIEHFAILPELRGSGYGKKTLHQISSLFSGYPIILEVEPPENRIAERRIAFYQSCGYHLSDEYYEQPPYAQGGASIPLRIMSYPKPIEHELFLAFCKSTRATVYQTV